MFAGYWRRSPFSRLSNFRRSHQHRSFCLSLRHQHRLPVRHGKKVDQEEETRAVTMGSLSNCRFYENPFPAIDELVVVQVRQIAEMGAYVKLLEYDNIEGMILLSELSRRRIRSINKLIRVGRNEVVVVLRVDQEKGINLLCSPNADIEDTSTYQSEGCLLRMLSRLRNGSIRPRQCIPFFVTSPKRRMSRLRIYIRPLAGLYTENMGTHTMLSRLPSRILLPLSPSLMHQTIG